MGSSLFVNKGVKYNFVCKISTQDNFLNFAFSSNALRHVTISFTFRYRLFYFLCLFRSSILRLRFWSFYPFWLLNFYLYPKCHVVHRRNSFFHVSLVFRCYSFKIHAKTNQKHPTNTPKLIFTNSHWLQFCSSEWSAQSFFTLHLSPGDLISSPLSHRKRSSFDMKDSSRNPVNRWHREKNSGFHLLSRGNKRMEEMFSLAPRKRPEFRSWKLLLMAEALLAL